MLDTLDDLRFFIALVGAGSLSAAARALDSSPTAMSRRLTALEERLGVRLIARSTRAFEVTEEGAVFHERCLKIVADIEEAEAEAAQGALSPRGLIRIGVPMEIGRRKIAPLVADFVALYPNVEALLIPSDNGLSLFEDRVDVSLRIGLPIEQDVVVTKIISTRKVLCAAPAFIARYGKPGTPADLASLNCIRLVRGRNNGDTWRFTRDGQVTDVKVRGSLATTSAEVVHDWVLAGRGISFKARWDIVSDLAEGRLVECLLDYQSEEITLLAVYASRKHLPPRLRLFIDFVKERLVQSCAVSQRLAG